MEYLPHISSGLPCLDRTIDSLRLGDNVVWQVDAVADYAKFVAPFVNWTRTAGRRIVYIRFADHRPVIANLEGVIVHNLDASGGFEAFATTVYELLAREGEEVFYVFDCLSDLLTNWASDLMIGNFFRIVCPYLFELNTVAWFAIQRNHHSFNTIARIRETTQILIEIYNCEGRWYLHPLKVWNRYSPTMFLPHALEDTGAEPDLVPITSSVDAARLFNRLPKTGLASERRNLDYWDRLFMMAGEVYAAALDGRNGSQSAQADVGDQLSRLLLTRDERLLALAHRCLGLGDLLDIKTRLIGSGYIGGKALGMLIARAILKQADDIDWPACLEPHDSWYIGADVFYAYIIENGWWKLRMTQRQPEGYFTVAPDLKARLRQGQFPDAIKEQFQQMLEYFGQSPIIVRSSSLLEDAFGNAFAGKYESVFCVNQGSPAQRYKQFEQAVKTVYASTLDEDALSYRMQRGLAQREEQMAILVQRVSGSYRGTCFYPDLAGVGISYNSYVWKEGMDARAGMLRLVYGLGTRAVDRVDGDYPRIVALDEPLLRPHAGLDDLRRYSQHDVDVLNIETNALETVALNDLQARERDPLLPLIAIRDQTAIRHRRERGLPYQDIWILTFEKLLTETPFASLMQRLLQTLEAAYEYPVDIEFTANFRELGPPQINLLQCRPLQARGLQKQVTLPRAIPAHRRIIETQGNFMGGSIAQPIQRVILVDPAAYTALPHHRKSEIARVVGRLNRQITCREQQPVLLAGPGRWGTSSPSLGVPVSFSEISNMTALAEISFSTAGLVPELSFGTHFFQNLVESGIFYLALFPEKPAVQYDPERLIAGKNRLAHLLPEDAAFEKVIQVVEFDPPLMLLADILSQKLVLMFQ